MIYFDNDAATIFVLADQKLAITRWKGFASSEELRQLLNKGLEILDQYVIHFWLNDNRKMKVIRPADQEYIVKEWLPVYNQKSQLRKSVSIETEDIFSKMSVESIARQADKHTPYETATFVSFNNAVQWLGVDLTEEYLNQWAA